MSRRWCVLTALALAACGGHGASPDAGADAAIDAGAGGFVPDPVTMGEDLPAVIPVLKVDVGGAAIELDVEIPGTITVYEQHDGTLTDLDTQAPTLSAPVGF